MSTTFVCKGLFLKTLFISLVATTIISCGGSGSNASAATHSIPAKKTPTNEEAIHFGNSGYASDDRLPCERGRHTQKFCDLQIYQIMVEAFVDGDPSVGYGVGWGPSQHQGDLQGVLDSLDYIKSLGFNTIWLTPIFDSNGSSKIDATGYFVQNYFKIDPNFGDEGLFKILVDAIHDRGMYILLDGVFGHHKGNVAPSPNGLKPRDVNAQGMNGYLSNYPEDREFYQEVIRFWMNEFKIDGWRLDQAYQVPIAMWQVFQSTVDEAANQNGTLGYMVAEIWDGDGKQIQQAGYGDNEIQGLRSAFDFPLRYKLVQVFAGQEDTSVSYAAEVDAIELNGNYGLNRHNVLPDHAIPNLMIGNHDLVRFGDLIERHGLATPADEEYWLRHKAAFTFLYSFSGPITVYYGEEIGDEVENFAGKITNNCGSHDRCDDHVSRSDGKVSKVNHQLSADEKNLHDYVKKLALVRSQNPALYTGKRVQINLSEDRNILALDKTAGDNKVLYILNMTGNEQSIMISATDDLDPDTQYLTNLMTDEKLAVVNDIFTVAIPQYSAVLLRVEP